ACEASGQERQQQVMQGGSGVNACKTLAWPENTRSATPRIAASRFELPLLGSNQDSPDPESGVLPITPRGTETTIVHRDRFRAGRTKGGGRYDGGRYYSGHPSPSAASRSAA